MKNSPIISQKLRSAIESLAAIDIPAKGRIAHHIRTGRTQRALALCAAGQLFIWKHIWTGARPILLEQLRLLKQLEMLIRSEANVTPAG